MAGPTIGDVNLNVLPDFATFERRIREFERRATINLRVNGGAPLGKITGQIKEFDKSLEAANARVVAFGASVGVISAVVGAIRTMVTESIKLDGTLTELNSIFGKSIEALNVFRDQLFNVAKSTGQTFATVAEAAKEFARQGLSAEETLKRTKDALVLVRISGLSADDAVKTLTASVNTFKELAGNTTTVVDKLTAVDARFAVSSKDLAEALSRVGNSAEDAGVGFDQLLGLVTAVQQRTARGGAVIGNALKTIFNRESRSTTLDQLEAIGIAVKDVEGNLRPFVDVLDEVADKLNTLPQEQRGAIENLLGGVYQINILKAELKDLADKNSIVAQAAATAANAQGDALKRNQALNQSLEAQANAALVSAQRLAGVLGKDIFGPALKNIFAGANLLGGIFNEEDGVDSGEKLARGFIKGFGNVLGGPGLAIAGILAGKFFTKFASFATESLGPLTGIGQPAQKVVELQKQIGILLSEERGLAASIQAGLLTREQIERRIASAIEARIAAQQREAALFRGVATNLSARGYGAAGGEFKNVKNRAGGNIPRSSIPPYAVANEVAEAKKAGYTISPSDVRAMRGKIDGKSATIVYNTKERVINTASGEPMILPPNVKNYASGFPGGEEGAFMRREQFARNTARIEKLYQDLRARLAREKLETVKRELREFRRIEASYGLKPGQGGELLGAAKATGIPLGSLPLLPDKPIGAAYGRRPIGQPEPGYFSKLGDRFNNRISQSGEFLRNGFSYRSERAQRIGGGLAGAGLAASFLGPVIGSGLGRQGEAIATGVSSGIGIAAVGAGLGPIGAAIGGLVGGFIALKSVVDNLTPSLEDLKESFAKENDRRQSNLQIGGDLLQAAQRFNSSDITEKERSDIFQQMRGLLSKTDSRGNYVFKPKDIKRISESNFNEDVIGEINKDRAQKAARKQAAQEARELAKSLANEKRATLFGSTTLGTAAGKVNNILFDDFDKLLGIKNTKTSVFGGKENFSIAKSLFNSRDFDGATPTSLREDAEFYRTLGRDTQFQNSKQALSFFKDAAEDAGFADSGRLLQTVFDENVNNPNSSEEKAIEDLRQIFDKLGSAADETATRLEILTKRTAEYIKSEGIREKAARGLDINRQRLGYNSIIATKNSDFNNARDLAGAFGDFNSFTGGSRLDLEKALNLASIQNEREIGNLSFQSNSLGIFEELKNTKLPKDLRDIVDSLPNVIGSSNERTLNKFDIINKGLAGAGNTTEEIQRYTGIRAKIDELTISYANQNTELDKQINATKVLTEVTRGFVGAAALLSRQNVGKILSGQGSNFGAIRDGNQAVIDQATFRNTQTFKNGVGVFGQSSAQARSDLKTRFDEENLGFSRRIAGGLIEGFQSGALPTSASINGIDTLENVSAADKKRFREEAEKLNANSKRRLAYANLDILNNETKLNLGSSVNPILDNLGSLLNNNTVANPRSINAARNALNSGDYGSLRNIISNFAKSSKPEYRGVFNTTLGSITDAETSRALNPARAGQQAIEQAGGEYRPLDVASFNKGVGLITAALSPEKQGQKIETAPPVQKVEATYTVNVNGQSTLLTNFEEMVGILDKVKEESEKKFNALFTYVRAIQQGVPPPPIA